MTTETKRQIIHIILCAPAFLFKYLSRWQAATLVLFILVIVLAVVPHSKLKFHLYRLEETKYSYGAIMYFFAILFLILCFPLFIAAAGLVVLALGDGLATLVGQHFKTKKMPWNQNKSYAGTTAFILGSFLGIVIILHWFRPDLGKNFVYLVALKTAMIVAIVESLPWKINDNISVPIASALLLNLMVS